MAGDPLIFGTTERKENQMSHVTHTRPVHPSIEQTWDLETAPIREQIVRQVGGLISLGISLLNVLICLRFLLVLLDANRANDFVRFVFLTTQPFLAIFQGLIHSPVYKQVEFELISLLAITVYSLLGWIMIRLLSILFARGK
jgi:hypothetical protein